MSWGKPTTFDVAVVGGGPAGVATAAALVERGAKVVLLERSDYGETRIGETLPPAVQQPLAALGLWESFLSLNSLPSPGTQSAWGTAQPALRSFLFDPFGHGWHVDRRAFDEQLASAAEARGVVVARGCRVQDLAAERDGGWQLRAAYGHETLRVPARFLVDATGRTGLVSKRLGATRVRADRLIALAAFYVRWADRAQPAADEPGTTLIEASADGWWYSAPLPRGRRVAAFLTDCDLFPSGADGPWWAYHAELAAVPHTRAGLEEHLQIGEVRRLAADTSWLAEPCATNWLAVGDAAFACDPLSGDGVARALAAGPAAAEAIVAALGGDFAPLGGYAERIESQRQQYLAARQSLYEREGRWAHSEFWSRRHQPQLDAEVAA